LWRIFGGFDQFCTGFFLSVRSGGIMVILEFLIAKSNFVITLSCIKKNPKTQLIKSNLIFALATPKIKPNGKQKTPLPLG
jgi:hypothetical protein